MTIKNRNRLLIAFIGFSVLCFVGTAIIFMTRIFSSTYQELYGTKFFSFIDFSLIKPRTKTTIFSLIFLQFYITATAFFLYFEFEKTQTSLIILFCLFLFGCQLNVSKLIVGLYGLNKTYSTLYLFIGKSILLGNLLILGSFFLISTESKESQKLNIETDLIILIAICIFSTYRIPINTINVKSAFSILPGYTPLLIIFAAVLTLLTILTFGISYHESENNSIIKILVSYIHLFLGIHLLLDSAIFLVSLLGAFLLSSGTYLFMRALHKMYLWN